MRVVLREVRGDPVPSEGDEGFLYLIAYLDNQKVYRYKWGFFRVTRVGIEPKARDYLKYTLFIEKIDYVEGPQTPKHTKHPKPATPKHKSPVREEGTSSAGKKKKQSHDNLKQLKLPF